MKGGIWIYFSRSPPQTLWISAMFTANHLIWKQMFSSQFSLTLSCASTPQPSPSPYTLTHSDCHTPSHTEPAGAHWTRGNCEALTIIESQCNCSAFICALTYICWDQVAPSWLNPALKKYGVPSDSLWIRSNPVGSAWAKAKLSDPLIKIQTVIDTPSYL